jgi:hypothetical protein
MDGDESEFETLGDEASAEAAAEAYAEAEAEAAHEDEEV